MKALYFLLPVVYVNCILQVDLKPIHRLEIIQNGKHASTPTPVQNVTEVPTVTDTPEVKAAKKAHGDAHNFWKSISQTRGNLPTNIRKLQSNNNVDEGKNTIKISESTRDPNKKRYSKAAHNDTIHRSSSDGSFVDPTTHQKKVAEHLKALRDVIALQLLSYNGDPETTKIPSTLQVYPIQINKDAKKSKSNDIVIEMQKKLVVIAAARALMEILEA